MSEPIHTACGLDCYDACRIVTDGTHFPKMHGDKEHPAGNGALCALINKSIHEAERIAQPRVDGKVVSMEEAMAAVAETFKAERSLLWRGSGNLGVMQEVTSLFMEKTGGSLTHGSLCDAAGEAGILLGRGVHRNLPVEQIAKADTVVVWGRNVTVTNAHLMPFIEGKTLVVIDPVRTALAKKADLHVQIEPRMDYYVAILLARFVFMEDGEDIEWLEEFAPEFEDFYDYTREHRIKAILEHIGTDLGEMGRILELMRDRKVVFLVGAGVQKYSTGSYTLQAIDALAAVLGLFGKEGCGVHYLGDSKLGFENPFSVKTTSVPKATTNFSYFDTVLVQGGNPAASMPDTNRVKRELEGVENLIYFGLYENETSKIARIVIPAKNFFEKEDVRLSYGHHYVQKMNKVIESEIGISEYDFTRYLFDVFGFDGLESEAAYIDKWLSQCKEENGFLCSPAYEEIPYEEGFGKSGDEEFEFIDDYDDDFINPKRFTKYRKKSTTKPKDEHGEHTFSVYLNEDVRPNCVVVTNNTIGVNYLTPAILSEEGHNACYQEVKVRIERI